jgi:hypothetical protein
MGRTTRKRAEAELTVEERIKLGAAREIIAQFADREPPPEELSELGYEQRMARARALELAVGYLQGRVMPQATPTAVLGWADSFYAFIWRGETEERK